MNGRGWLIAVALALAAAVSGCEAGDVDLYRTVNPDGFPVSADPYEGAGGDDTAATATPLALNIQQPRTIFPTGDRDWVWLSLGAGTKYEFSAKRLSLRGNTVLELYDSAESLLASDDDHVFRDSAIQYTPTASGPYYLLVKGYSTNGVTTYILSARVFSDGDSDGYSPYYDCDDSDATVYPQYLGTNEIPADGTDQNCDGTDEPNATDSDSYEPDDSLESARAANLAAGSHGEIPFRPELYIGNARTLHAEFQEDWFWITVPGLSKYYVGTLFNKVSGSGLSASLYDSGGGLQQGPVSGNPFFEVNNTDSTARSYYLRFAAGSGTSTGYYAVYVENLGTDLDSDGYFSMDGPSAANGFADKYDCDDNAGGVFPGASETIGDGVDSNCNGSDDT